MMVRQYGPNGRGYECMSDICVYILVRKCMSDICVYILVRIEMGHLVVEVDFAVGTQISPEQRRVCCENSSHFNLAHSTKNQP